jgi:acylphosphatase
MKLLEILGTAPTGGTQGHTMAETAQHFYNATPREGWLRERDRGYERREVTVRGIVQGVGFRPFIYSLAQRYRLTGLVRNDVEGVYIEVEGPSSKLDAFLRCIAVEAPPLAVVEAVSWRPLTVRGEHDFRIEESG